MLKRNPIFTITLGFICTFLLILSLAWHLYEDQSNTKRQLIQLEKIEDIRLKLNQFYNDLTTFLRVQIVHPSQHDNTVYLQTIQSLNKVMHDAKLYASENDVLPVYYKLKKLQTEILTDQNTVLTLIKNNQPHAAQNILLNPQYHNREVQYASTVLQLINANSSYQYWLTLCNDLLMYQNYQTSLMYLLIKNNSVMLTSYNNYHVRILHLLKQAIDAANPLIEITPFKKALEDYQKINALNLVISSDMKQGLQFQAQSILLSKKYRDARNNYNNNIALASYKIKQLIQDKINIASENHDMIAIILAVIIAIFLILWVSIISMIRHWKTKLEQTNKILDKKVEKRTKKLINEMRAHQEAEEEKSKLENVLRQNQKLHSIGVLAAGIAHDFNNLLAIIVANAESFQLKDKDNIDSQESLLEAAQEAAQLTQQLLTFARKSPQKKSENNINDLILKTTHLLEPSLPHNITGQCDLSKEALIAEIDPTQITQVLLNIAINAKDAMPDGGTISFKSSNEKHDTTHFAVIKIIDTGTGIAEEDIDQIFDPFFTKKDVNKGTGLGLATAYGIIQQHQGRIEVISDHTGTQFTIYIPLKEKK